MANPTWTINQAFGDDPSVAKKQYRNRAGVLEKPCSGTFGSWLHAFLGKTGTSPKVKSSVTLPFRKIRNCKGLKVPLPGFDIGTSGYIYGEQTFGILGWFKV
jgi:hypothetical protein